MMTHAPGLPEQHAIAGSIVALRAEVATLHERVDREHENLVQALCLSGRLAGALSIIADQLQIQAEDASGYPGAMPPSVAAILIGQINEAEIELQGAFARFKEESRAKALASLLASWRRGMTPPRADGEERFTAPETHTS